jgi:heme-degrading monooxygenase HmoA
MIIRVFRPTIRPGKEREFEAFLRDTAVPLVSQQAGLLAQHVGRPRDPSSTEYVYVTVWEDFESVRAFAGERWQEAVITLTRSTCSRTPGSATTRSSRHPSKGFQVLRWRLRRLPAAAGGIGAQRGGLGWCCWRAHWSASIDRRR